MEKGATFAPDHGSSQAGSPVATPDRIPIRRRLASQDEKYRPIWSTIFEGASKMVVASLRAPPFLADAILKSE